MKESTKKNLKRITYITGITAGLSLLIYNLYKLDFNRDKEYVKHIEIPEIIRILKKSGVKITSKINPGDIIKIQDTLIKIGKFGGGEIFFSDRGWGIKNFQILLMIDYVFRLKP